MLTKKQLESFVTDIRHTYKEENLNIRDRKCEEELCILNKEVVLAKTTKISKRNRIWYYINFRF